MVTRNVSRAAKAFHSASEDRDYAFFGAIALTSAIGGVAAADASARLLGVILGVDPETGTLTQGQRIANGTTKVAFGGLLGLLGGAAGLDNYIGQGLAIAGIGATAVGGADLLGVGLQAAPTGRIFSETRRSLPSGGDGAQAQLQKARNSHRGMSANHGHTPSAYS